MFVCSRSAAATSPEGERVTLTLILAGDKGARDWQSGKPVNFNAFDAKAETLALLEAAGAPVANLQSAADAGPTWHPGRSASLGLGPKTILARFGELHPSLTRGLPARARSRRKSISMRSPSRAVGWSRSSRLRPAGAAIGHPRLRLHRPRRARRRRPGPSHSRQRQGRDHRRAAVRPLRNRRRLVAGDRGYASATRQDLHRG